MSSDWPSLSSDCGNLWERVGEREPPQSTEEEQIPSGSVTGAATESTFEANSFISWGCCFKQHVWRPVRLAAEGEEAQAWPFSQGLNRISVPEEVRGALLTIPVIAWSGIEKSDISQYRTQSEIHFFPYSPIPVSVDYHSGLQKISKYPSFLKTANQSDTGCLFPLCRTTQEVGSCL